MTERFLKTRAGAPAGFFAVEAAGLAWLAAATGAGGARVVDVLEVTAESLVLPRLQPVAPTTALAEDFGRALARTHAAGAPAFGCPPAGWDGDGFIATLPLPHRPADAEPLPWGAFWARYRLEPFLRRARDAGAVDAAGAAVVDAVCARAEAGEWDAGPGGAPEPPSRLHGDLWSGNVVWTASGAVLIDPAASGGHRESDLAMLALFGLPHLERVLAAYREAAQEVAPLADGWRERVGLHQLHPLLVHAALFGGSYGDRAVRVARRC